MWQIVVVPYLLNRWMTFIDVTVGINLWNSNGVSYYLQWAIPTISPLDIYRNNEILDF